MQPLEPLNAITPLDGRYRSRIEALSEFFSEYALIRYRARVEIEYLLALSALDLRQLSRATDEEIRMLRGICQQFSLEDARTVKAREGETNHDVKALEYVLGEKIATLISDDERSDELRLFLHFGLTSQDVNNTAFPMMLRDAFQEVFFPELEAFIQRIQAAALSWRTTAMLSHTHGQPASPTTMGKEMAVFHERLEHQYQILRELPYPAKFSGATGNFNAHYAAYPEVDWAAFADRLVEGTLGLRRTRTTTQIDHYDGLAAIFDALRRINVILMDFCRDLWAYISMGYFRLKVRRSEVGSSTMPHKVNPIDFENAEGNLGLANALLDHLSNKLPVSRLQRDLTDSTVLRNIGVAVGHSYLALLSAAKGLGKLELDEDRIIRHLSSYPIVLTEAIQTILRREGMPDAYERVKDFSRGAEVLDLHELTAFIDTLPVEDSVKDELRALTPYNYTGNAAWAPFEQN